MHTVSYVSLFHCFVASFRFVVSSLLFRLEQWSCRCPTWPTQGQRLQRQLLQNLLPCIVPPYERIREKEDRSRLIVWQKLCALVSVHTARASLSQSSATDCASGLAPRVPRRVASSSWSAKAPAFVKKNGQFLLSCLSFFRTCRTWQSEMGTLFPTLLYHFRPAFTHIQGYFSLMRRFIFCVKS